MAMAAARAGEDPLLRRWGLRNITTGAPVTPDTVFPICSVIKSFTAAAIALLVDKGRLDWDAPVRTVLPEFRLRDTVATEQASLRDLLTHRIGLLRHDCVTYGRRLHNAGTLAAPHHLEPSKPFRGVWQYNNLIISWLLILERASGEPWEDFVRTHILLPLGIERTRTSLEDMLARHPDCAMGHAVLDGEQRRIPVRSDLCAAGQRRANNASGSCQFLATFRNYSTGSRVRWVHAGPGNRSKSKLHLHRGGCEPDPPRPRYTVILIPPFLRVGIHTVPVDLFDPANILPKDVRVRPQQDQVDVAIRVRFSPSMRADQSGGP